MSKRNLLIGGGILLLVILGGIGISRLYQNGAQESAASAGTLTVKQLYDQAAVLRKDGRMLEAKKLYLQILQDHPDYENMEAMQKELENLNMQIIFSNLVTPETVLHEVKNGDTLGKIAKEYNTTVELIQKSNNIKKDVIRAGQKLRIWRGKFNIFVDKSQNILILKEDNEVVKVYRVSTGEKNSTPVGEFTIVNKLEDPVWFNRGVVVPPESPANVLGSRWLGFDMPGYGIHGTIEPETIGQQMTAGCVRMLNKEVEELYSLIPIGTKVVIVD